MRFLPFQRLPPRQMSQNRNLGTYLNCGLELSCNELYTRTAGKLFPGRCLSCCNSGLICISCFLLVCGQYRDLRRDLGLFVHEAHGQLVHLVHLCLLCHLYHLGLHGRGRTLSLGSCHALCYPWKKMTYFKPIDLMRLIILTLK